MTEQSSVQTFKVARGHGRRVVRFAWIGPGLFALFANALGIAAENPAELFAGRWIMQRSTEECDGKEGPPIKASGIVFSISDGWLKRSGYTVSDDENDHYTEFEARPDGKEYKILSYLEKQGHEVSGAEKRFVTVRTQFPSIGITITDGNQRVRSAMFCDLTLDRTLECRSSWKRWDGKQKECSYRRSYRRER